MPQSCNTQVTEIEAISNAPRSRNYSEQREGDPIMSTGINMCNGAESNV